MFAILCLYADRHHCCPQLPLRLTRSKTSLFFLNVGLASVLTLSQICSAPKRVLLSNQHLLPISMVHESKRNSICFSNIMFGYKMCLHSPSSKPLVRYGSMQSTEEVAVVEKTANKSPLIPLPTFSLHVEFLFLWKQRLYGYKYTLLLSVFT